MSEGLVFITGGARSGKSSFAEQLARGLNKTTTYIATAQVLDREMENRIQKHKERRPSTWKTLEAPYALPRAILDCKDQAEVLLIDCLTLFLSNLLTKQIGQLGVEDNPVIPEELETLLLAKVEELIDAIHQFSKTVILVSNEVGSGIVPLYHSARAYRDVVGRANQRLAAVAHRAFLVVAGLPMELKKREPTILQVVQELS